MFQVIKNNNGSIIKLPLIQWVKSQVKYSIPIDKIRTPFGEIFNVNNHWVKTLDEYEKGIINYKRSSLFKFHNNFQPKNIFHIVDPSENLKDDELPMGSYPWGRWTSRKNQSEWKQSCHCGPSDDGLIKKEWEDFIFLYEKIKEEGLNFKKYGNPLGLFFVDEKNEKYFIVLGGNHRIAIAFYLNIPVIPVRLLPRHYLTSQVVRYKKIKDNFLSRVVFKSIVSNDFVDWENKEK